MRHLSLAFLVVACGGDNKQTIDAPGQPIDAAKTIDAPAVQIDAAMETVVDIGSGGANALLFDGTNLFITDNTADALDKANGSGETSFATLPAQSAGVSLGGMVTEADGSILIANFGFGTQGSLVEVPAAGGSGTNVTTGLDPARRRIGLAKDSAGTLYTSYFQKVGMNQVGGVSSLVIGGGSATETEIAGNSTSAGFAKVVGIAATPTAVFVSDQTVSKIFKIDLTASNAVTELATVPTADLLTMLPNGDLLTGGGSAISRVTQTGTVSALTLVGSPTFEQVRGITFDSTHDLLFVVDHSATVGVNDKLHIIPFTP